MGTNQCTTHAKPTCYMRFENIQQLLLLVLAAVAMHSSARACTHSNNLLFRCLKQSTYLIPKACSLHPPPSPHTVRLPPACRKHSYRPLSMYGNPYVFSSLRLLSSPLGVLGKRSSRTAVSSDFCLLCSRVRSSVRAELAWYFHKSNALSARQKGSACLILRVKKNE